MRFRKCHGLFKVLIFSALSAFIVFQTCQAQQNPYRTNLGIEIPITVGALGADLGLLYSQRQLNVLDTATISGLDVADIPGIDRIATRQWSPTAANFSHALVGLSAVGAITVSMTRGPRSRIVETGVIFAESFLMNELITNSTKLWVRRTRPFVYNDDAPLKKKREHDARLSFVSGHSSVAAVFCFSAASVYTDWYPDRKGKALVWAAAATIPAVTAALRVAAGKHFPTDVVAGYLVGAGSGLLVPWLHKRRQNKRTSLIITPNSLRISVLL